MVLSQTGIRAAASAVAQKSLLPPRLGDRLQMHEVPSGCVGGIVHDGDSLQTQEQVEDSLVVTDFTFFLQCVSYTSSEIGRSENPRAIGPAADETKFAVEGALHGLVARCPGMLPGLSNAQAVSAEMEEMPRAAEWFPQ